MPSNAFRSLVHRLWLHPRTRAWPRVALTLVALACAITLVSALWQAYVLAPWTRDGRVSAHVVRIAPEVSGTVVEVAVTDNQRVARGDLLYRLDTDRFALAVGQAQARLDAAALGLRQRDDEARRRRGLDDLVPAEDIARTARAAAIAQAEQTQALADLKLAQLNLARSVVRSPVDGYVTHLQLRAGDYASAGTPGVAVIDAHSFWITSYFEETKLRHVHPGAHAQIRLMGFTSLLDGHVGSIGHGIADENALADDAGLPRVNPSFSWIRLAQRIPVRIEIDRVPADVLLAAGMTCSVDVADAGAGATPRGRLAHWLQQWL